MSISIGTLMANIGGNIAPLQAALAQAQAEMTAASKTMASSMAAFNASLMASSVAMKTVGRTMSTSLTLPLLLLGGAAISLSKDFETSMTKIIGLVGVAKEQVAEWSDEILKIAPALGKSPKELADALFFITSAGIRGAEAMDVLEMSAKGSAIGLGEVKVVADLVTSAMNAYGKENLSAAMATDILTNTVREGKAEAPALAAALGQVLPIAAEMGVTFSQVGAAVAAMTRTGTNARTASMQLKNILKAMLKPIGDAEQAMTDMGTSSEQFRKIIEDDGLLAALMRVREMAQENDKTAFAKVFPNIRALMGALDMMGKNVEDNIKIFNSLENSSGLLAIAFEEVQETADFKLNKSLASAKTVLTKMGQELKGPFANAMDGLSESLQNVAAWMDSLSEAQKENILRFVGIAAAIGPVIWVMGSLLGTVGKLIKGFMALRVVMLTNPITATMVAVAALTVGIVKLVKSKKEYQAVSRDVITNIAVEKAGMNALFSILTSTTTSTEARREAIKELNDKYGEYLPNLLTEKTSLEDIKTAQDNANKSLVKSIVLKSRQDDILKTNTKAVNDLRKGHEDLRDVLESTTTQRSGYLSKASESEMKALEIAVVDIIQRLKGEGFGPIMEEIRGVSSELGLAVGGRMGELGNAVISILNAEIDRKNNLGEINEEYENLIKLLGIVENKGVAGADPEGGGLPGGGGPQNRELGIIEKLNKELTELRENRILATTVEDIGKYDQLIAAKEKELSVYQRIKPEIKNLTSVMKDYYQSLILAEGKGEIYGETFDVIGEKIEATKKALESLLSLNYDPLSKEVKALRTELDRLNDAAEPTKSVWDEYRRGMKQASDQNKVLGKTFNLAAEQASLTRGAIIALLEAGGGWSGSGIQALSKNLEKFEAQMKVVKETTYETAQIIEDALEQAAMAALESIAHMISGTGEIDSFFNSLANILGSFLIQMGEAILAYGIAVAAFEAAFGNPFVAILAGAALIVAGYVVQDLAAEGLEHGGVIPEGYPNDTYPAMLTSGEVVTPAGALPDLENSKSIFDGSTWRFVIEGPDLVAVLDKQNTLNNSY